VLSERFHTRGVQCFLPQSSFLPPIAVSSYTPFLHGLADFFFDCTAICFLTGVFFSSSFFQRLQANISLLAPTLLLEVILCFLPTSVVIYSSGLLPSDVPCLSRFIFGSFDTCSLRNVSHSLLTLDSWLLHFAGIRENTCSWNNNKNTSQESCCLWWIYDIRVYACVRPNHRQMLKSLSLMKVLNSCSGL
jgi:hypothetical protein